MTNHDLHTQPCVAAVEHNCTVADIINDALEEWFAEAEETPPVS